MTTETLTPPAAQAQAAATPAAGNTYSVLGLVLSILSIPLAMTPLAIAGVVLGFIGRRKEPAAVTTANWSIVVGLVSLFGWILLGALGVALFAPFAFAGWAAGWF